MYYTADCDGGSPLWDFFYYDSVTPADSSIEFEIRTGPTVHMNTTPTAIGTAGTPATVAAPARSYFQTDSVGLKMRLGCSWVLRTTGAVAWVENVVW